MEVCVSKLKMKNPIMLASGILGSKPASLLKIAEHAGAVITKSVGYVREGNKNPTVLNYKCYLTNAVGLPSEGVEVFSKRLEEKVKDFKSLNSHLIVSLFAGKAEDFAKFVGYFPFASAFELNLSCPHAEGLGMEIGISTEEVKSIVEVVKCATDKPVFVKLTPNVTNIVEIGKAAEKGGADAVVAINTLKGMAIDISSRKPILSHVIGGVSGKAIKPVALRCVWDLYRNLSIPIIGCGGVTNWIDALEFILAGASAVEVGSAFLYSYRIVEGIVKGLEEYLSLHGEKIENLIGAANSRC